MIGGTMTCFVIFLVGLLKFQSNLKVTMRGNALRDMSHSFMKMWSGFATQMKLNPEKLQYFGHLMRRVDSLEKTLILGGIGGRRRR